jgi:hypothetical protein
LSSATAEDDFAHDVRVALSQKGDKAPISLRTVPMVLCGPQLSQHVRSPGAGDVGSGGGGLSSSSNVPGGAGGGNGNAAGSVAAGGGGSGGSGGSGSRQSALTASDGRLRAFPSGATMVPYCAPGCEIPGVPSPFAILWVCPMTNFVSITAVFPVCVTVNGRPAPFETPQRLLFGDQICVHAAGESSRPMLTYRFTRVEAPVVMNNERQDQRQQQRGAKAGGRAGAGGAGANRGAFGAAAADHDGDDQEDEVFRVRSLRTPMPEYRALPLSRYFANTDPLHKL